MRILMVVRHPGGGIKTFFRYIYAHPAFAGVDMRVLMAGGDIGDYLAPYLPEDRSLAINQIPSGTLGMCRAVRRAIRCSSPELLHSHGFTAGVVSEIARSGHPIPHLMTAHDVFLSSQFEGWHGRLKRLGLARFLARIDAIHAVSRDGAANITDFFPNVAEDRIRAILHGVDTERFGLARPNSIRHQMGLPGNAQLIGFFGRFMAQKGFRTLVDAVTILRKKDLLPANTYVITFGWGGFIREDYGYLKDQGLGDLFFQQPYAESPETIMAAMDVIAMPSRWEACGLLAMEALAAGVPLVGTSCIGLREVLDGSPAPAVEPGDDEALADALLCMLGEDKRESFRNYAPQARRRFALDRPAYALRQLCDEMVG